MKVIEIKDLVKRYTELTALDHISLEISEGEIFGLLGPNGSGKTTLINCILSLLKYDKGNIKIFNKDMTPYSYDIKQEIGVIMQNVAVINELTVYENIDYFCSLYINDKKLRKQYVEEAIDLVGLKDFVKFFPKKLSGGLLRRLNIACGIAHKPKLIIMDEPTVAVDPQSRNNILQGIKRLNKEGATIIYTSHYMEEVEQICTNIAILNKGKVVAKGTKEELKSMISFGEKIVIETYDLTQEHLEIFKKMINVVNVSYENHILTLNSKGSKSNLSNILDIINNNNISYGRIYSELPTLNDVFLEITGKQLRD